MYRAIKVRFPFSQRINGQTWSGVIKEYHVVPMVQGDFSITLPNIDIHYKTDSQDSEKFVYQGETIQFRATLPNAAAELEPIIIAEDITLSQNLNSPKELIAGSVISREVTVNVKNTSGLFIPNLLHQPSNKQIKAYTQPLSISDKLDDRSSEISSIVKQSQELLVLADGNVELEAIEISYYQPSSQTIQTERIEGATFTIKAAPLSIETKLTLLAAMLFFLTLITLLFRRVKTKINRLIYHINHSELVLYVKTKRYIASQPRLALHYYLMWRNAWHNELTNHIELANISKKIEVTLETALYYNQPDDNLLPVLKRLRKTLKCQSTARSLKRLNP